MSDSPNRVQIVFLSEMNVRSTRQLATISLLSGSELFISVDEPAYDDIVCEVSSASS